MGAPRDPNEHVPPSERKDHPAVQRMKRQKLMKKVKTYLTLFAILAGLLGVYVWKFMKSEGKDIKDISISDLKDAGSHLVSDAKDAGTEIVKGAEEEWDRQKSPPPTDAELDKIVKGKKGAQPPTPAPTPAPPTPQPGTTGTPATTPPPTPAPAPPAPALSPEEQKTKDMIQEANKAYDLAYDHHEKYRGLPASDAAGRKREINAAFDAVEKAKKLYQEAQGRVGEGSSDWLDQRVQECLQRYKVLKNAKGAN